MEARRMILGEVVKVAFRALAANTMRTVLTMLGIVIGVGSVITMVALGQGAQNAVSDRIAALGTTLIMINAQFAQRGGVTSQDIKPLTLADARAIEENARYVTIVQPQQDVRMQVQYRNRNVSIQVTGTSANFLESRKFTIAAGRMFTDAEDRMARRVAVLGWSAMEELGITDPESVIGEPIRVRGAQFIVVGVMGLKGLATGMMDANEQVLIPILTGRYRIFGRERLNDIFVLARSEHDIPLAMAELTRILRKSHRLRANQRDDFTMRFQTDFLESMNQSAQTFTFLLAGIAGVSLMVGGIGIMNIMLVSVTERTREIGVRKAVGATRLNILLQFLVEAIVICLIGGIIGIALGLGGATAMSDAFQWNVAIDLPTIGMAVLYSMAIGLTFGVWPARRASKLDPVEALRHE
jgi:putative ABC transport system permease protein